jgi:regulator of nucleoside diphosphate kinase
MTRTLKTNPVILLQDDYNLLHAYFKGSRPPGHVHENQKAKSLSEEIEKAIVVSKDKFPADTIRLNSTAIIKDAATNRVITVMVVLPEKADVKKNMISVLAPLGTALIGFRKGQQVSWEMPSGKRNFTIMEVYHSSSIN